MKITKKYLQDLIKEELTVLLEQAQEEERTRAHEYIDDRAAALKRVWDSEYRRSQKAGLSGAPQIRKVASGRPRSIAAQALGQRCLKGPSGEPVCPQLWLFSITPPVY
jgi:hypothetical protein